MNFYDIAILRLSNQWLEKSPAATIPEIVSHMGAIQAQDFAMSKWALGIRKPEATESSVEAAIDSGSIIRTHILRPTWHIIPASDIYWMLDLSAKRIKGSSNGRLKELELTPEVLSRCYALLEKTLLGNNHQTRDELVSLFEQHNIANYDNRVSHILVQAEQDGLICSGKIKQGKTTYALLPEWVPQKKSFSKEEALEKLARTYFFSHGPATLPDFQWWSGLSLSEVRKALELVKPDLLSEVIGTETYWFFNNNSVPIIKESLHLLPAFDEFIISYKDRSATLTLDHHKKAITKNGIFHPVILHNGIAVGIWKRLIKKQTVMVDIYPFSTFTESLKEPLENKIRQFGVFLNKETTIQYHS
ncbi:winged helix DNA-binding domain-containing protein [Flavobacterium cerinum]|uniref:Winged helix DNA-binding domain-containing protein n=1 Tax=Flavobacterium cerinum TaxID=2502784 RepID=A0ABY5IWM4_9FLAO|nr:winged helix DNA-binding domain-containing protein [Flavobacterium cerinum]UUC46143.1 winged helix DNA-binding domain-containing protein [Flavobacterium cerinum]